MKLASPKPKDKATKSVCWTLKEMKDYAQGMDSERCIHLEQDEAVFGEKRVVFVHRDNIFDLCAMKEIGQTVYMR